MKSQPKGWFLETGSNSKEVRRHLLKGQRAMRLAWLYPEPEKGGRGKRAETKTMAKRHGFSADRLSDARAVLRHSPELAKAVRDGSQIPHRSAHHCTGAPPVLAKIPVRGISPPRPSQKTRTADVPNSPEISG